MPRTKVSKNSKRNREAYIREEKIREFDSALAQGLEALDMKMKQDILEMETEIVLIKSRIPQKMLSMKLGDLMKLNVKTFSEVNVISNFAQLQRTDSQSSLQGEAPLPQSVTRSRDDEGYLTEESKSSASDSALANVSQLRIFPNTARFPGPLSSAKASRSRRSRSATGYPGSALKATHLSAVSSAHMSRMKTRTPMVSRKKAISADRTIKDLPSSPTALVRWPKPGETIISMTGSPVVANVMPENFANVNIPIKDGVLSLRPKKLKELDPELMQRIDQHTLSQIKLLQSNLELIMSYASQTRK